jgi:two-component system KDP operon response regulator KdpE
MNKTILVIDDEANILRFIRISLKTEGFVVLEAGDSQSGIDLFRSGKPHLVVLDLGLPDEDGLETLKRIRSISKSPILILTARDEESEKVKLLNAGANDYLSKPFGVAELVARIKVLLRDLVEVDCSEAPGEVTFKEFSLSEKNHTCMRDGEVIPLTKKEFELLSMLSLNPGKLVTYKELLVNIWGGHHEDDFHYIRIIISQLRKKIDNGISEAGLIQTEPGIGYRLVAKPLNARNLADD